MPTSISLRAAALAIALLAKAAAGAISEYMPTPQSIDPAASIGLDPHYVAIDRTVAPKGLLFVHLPGTDLSPGGSKLIVQGAALSGFHAIGLTYPNGMRPEEACQTSTDSLCFEKVHQEALEGTDSSPVYVISRADSIEGRLVKLLRYLDERFPSDGWGAYVNPSGNPVWTKINLSGFSQGSGHAAYIGYARVLHRLALMAGPNETYLDGRLAGWMTGPHATPASAYYGFSHQKDNGGLHLQMWQAFGLGAFGAPALVDGASSPFGGSHMLYTDLPIEGNDFHKSVCQDLVTPRRADGFPIYADVWKLIFGLDGTAAAATSSWILPSSAHVAGSGGAFYTTDLTVSNPGGEAGAFTLKFLGNGVDGRSGAEKTFSIPAGGTVSNADVLGSVFGLTNAFGAIRISSTLSGLVVLGQTSTPGFGGTFGQSVPAVSPLELASATVPRSIAGIREDASFRTNLFLANATGSAVAVDAALVSTSGQSLGTRRYELPPLGMIQASRVARDLGVSADVVGARLVLSTPTAGGAFAAYASTIDNTTNDPRTLLAR